MSGENPIAENHLDEYIEVLIFKNPFHPSFINEKKNKKISISESKKIIFDLFRVKLGEKQKSENLNTDGDERPKSNYSNEIFAFRKSFDEEKKSIFSAKDLEGDKKSDSSSQDFDDDEKSVSSSKNMDEKERSLNSSRRSEHKISMTSSNIQNLMNRTSGENESIIKENPSNPPNKSPFEQFLEYYNDQKLCISLLGNEIFPDQSELQYKIFRRRSSVLQKVNQDQEDPLINIPSFIMSLFNNFQDKSNESSKHLLEKDLDTILLLAVLTALTKAEFTFKLKESLNQKEIFVLVEVSESKLLDHAYFMNYRLKMRQESIPNNMFEKYSCGWKFTISDDRNNSKFNTLFATYDKSGLESTEGSRFTFTDKFRIVNKVLNQIMNLSVLSTKRKILTENLVLHDDDMIDEICKLAGPFACNSLPVNEIKIYFSESLALYFSFISTLMRFTFLLSLVGVVVYCIRLIHHFFDPEKKMNMVFIYFMFSFFLIFWAFWFVKTWERKEKYLAWKWGTLDFDDKQLQRSQFEGISGEDEVTGQMKIIKTESIKYSFFRVLNYLITVFFISFTLVAVLLTDQLKSVLLDSGFDMLTTEQIIGVVTFFQIYLFDFTFRSLAKKLTLLENHETIQAHNDSLIIKLFTFKFFNSYLSLFYVAFYKRNNEGRCTEGSCIRELSYRLFTIFSTTIVFNVIEIAYPWFKRFCKSREGFCLRRSKFCSARDEDVVRIEKQKILDKYDYAIKDYLEVITRLGYLVLFGSAHHLFGLVVWLGLLLESKVDAFKICRLYQRQEPTKINNIGVWKKILVFICICGVFTNAGISVFTTGLLKGYEMFDKVLIFTIAEHAFVVFICLFWVLIPDTPQLVGKAKNWGKRVAIERVKQAKNEENQENKRIEDNQSIFRFLSLDYLIQHCYPLIVYS